MRKTSWTLGTLITAVGGCVGELDTSDPTHEAADWQLIQFAEMAYLTSIDEACQELEVVCAEHAAGCSAYDIFCAPSRDEQNCLRDYFACRDGEGSQAACERFLTRSRCAELAEPSDPADPPPSDPPPSDPPPSDPPPSDPPPSDPPPSDPPPSDPPPSDPGSCSLTSSGPVRATRDGQIIENLRITSTTGSAILVDGFSGVVIRNVVIRHSGGVGIEVNGADDVTIENVDIENTQAPASGPNSSDELINIYCDGSSRLRVDRAKLVRGSTGVYLLECPESHLSMIEGHDFRGPFPRGQVVQWDKSDGGLLEDFSVINGATSWPEDNVNVYQSSNMTIRRGHIDGNNSPSGVGVIFDGGSRATGLVEDVDATRMGNGCFSDYDGGTNVTFRRTRCRSNLCGSQQGRGAPLSNALMWSGHESIRGIRLEDSSYWDSCNDNLVWPEESFVVLQLREENFTMRAPITLSFCWN